MELEHHGRSYLKSLIQNRYSGSIHVNGLVVDVEDVLNELNLNILKVDAMNLKVADFRVALRSFQMTSREKRVFLIDSAHLMSPEVYNTILKSLEEPRGFFILISPIALPLTVQSRLISVDFKSVKSDLTTISQFKLEEKMKMLDGKLDRSILDELTNIITENFIEYLEEFLELKKQFYLGLSIDVALISYLKKIEFL